MVPNDGLDNKDSSDWKHQGECLVKHQKDSYLAGLWEGDLIRGLLWAVRIPLQSRQPPPVMREVTHPYPGGSSHRWISEAWPLSWYEINGSLQDLGKRETPDSKMKSYLGPTWSCIAVNKPVDYTFAGVLGNPNYIRTEFKSDASVGETRWDSRSSSNFPGSSYIVLKGRLTKARLRPIQVPVFKDSVNFFDVEQQMDLEPVFRDTLFLIWTEVQGAKYLQVQTRI